MHVQLIPQNTVARLPRADKTATYQRQDLVFRNRLLFFRVCFVRLSTIQQGLTYFALRSSVKKLPPFLQQVAKTFVIVSQHVYQFEQSHQMFVAQSINAPIQH